MVQLTLNCALLLGLVAYTTSCLGSFTNIQTSVSSDTPAECVAPIDPKPFVKIGSNYYFIDTKHKFNWYDANDECKTYGADLLYVENAAEMTDISNYLIEHELVRYWWTSGNDLSREGIFKWSSTGQAMTFTKWSPFQPDNRFYEHCVHFWSYENVPFMNDINCTSEMNYICKLKKPKTVSFTVW